MSECLRCIDATRRSEIAQIRISTSWENMIMSVTYLTNPLPLTRLKKIMFALLAKMSIL